MIFFLKLVFLTSFMSIGLAGIIILLAQYGPLVVLGFVAGLIGLSYWKNEARKTEHREYDDKLSTLRQDKAFEEHVKRMKLLESEE